MQDHQEAGEGEEIEWATKSYVFFLVLLACVCVYVGVCVCVFLSSEIKIPSGKEVSFFQQTGSLTTQREKSKPRLMSMTTMHDRVLRMDLGALGLILALRSTRTWVLAKLASTVMWGDEPGPYPAEAGQIIISLPLRRDDDDGDLSCPFPRSLPLYISTLLAK